MRFVSLALFLLSSVFPTESDAALFLAEWNGVVSNEAGTSPTLFEPSFTFGSAVSGT